MNRVDNLRIVSRVFCVAAVLGLSLALQDVVALQSTILLAAISATAMGVDLSMRLPQAWTVAAEAALAGLVIGLVLPQGFVLLPYLVMPALIAGATRGVKAVSIVVIAETASLTALTAVSGGGNEVALAFEIVAPWLLTSLGVGLLMTWMRRLRGGATAPASDPTYESAHRLLSQLRTVARRLSSGLDTVGMAGHLLATVHDHLEDTHAALFVRTEGGVLTPVDYRGADAKAELLPTDPLIQACWEEMEPANAVQASGDAARRYRTALPLRVGPRMIGVVLADSGALPDATSLAALMQEVNEHSLRLDTALVFDEVRTIATTEERRRLAREIHDGVAQEIASLGYLVDGLAATAGDGQQRERLHGLRSELTRVVSELRLSIFDLRSEVSPSTGLGTALSDYARQVGTSSNMTVHLTLAEAPTRLRSEVEAELLRIAQEAITNSRKHSGARNLWVDCQIQPPSARIEVRDDGTGLGSARTDSYGMRIMKERADRIDARLQINTAGPGGPLTGTTVAVTVGTEPSLSRPQRTGPSDDVTTGSFRTTRR